MTYHLIFEGGLQLSCWIELNKLKLEITYQSQGTLKEECHMGHC